MLIFTKDNFVWLLLLFLCVLNFDIVYCQDVSLLLLIHRIIFLGLFIILLKAKWQLDNNALNLLSRKVKIKLALNYGFRNLFFRRTCLESRVHLFFDYPFSKRLWQQVMSYCVIKSRVYNWYQVVLWCKNKLKGRSFKSTISKLARFSMFIMVGLKEILVYSAAMSSLRKH